MPQFDLPLVDLRLPSPDVEEPRGLHTFWDRVVAAGHERQTKPVLTPHLPKTYSVLVVDDRGAGASGPEHSGVMRRRLASPIRGAR